MTEDAGSRQPFVTPTRQDELEVRGAVEDYYGAWFDADPDRVARVPHPQLAKRGCVADAHGKRVLDFERFETMVESTRMGSGRQKEDGAECALEIRIVEVYGDVATALVHTPRYIETLQLIRTNDGRRILNALWTMP